MTPRSRRRNEAGDPAIASCALAYRSYIPSTKGANGRARVLLTEALENISETGRPRLRSHGSRPGTRRKARNSATRPRRWHHGDAPRRHSASADPDEDRAWTRFLDQDRFDSYRIATYSKIGKLDEAQEIAAAVLARLTQPDKKKAVIIFEDIAGPPRARFSQRGIADRPEGPRGPAGNRIRHVAAEIRRDRPED